MTPQEQADYWKKYKKQNDDMERMAFIILMSLIKDSIAEALVFMDQFGVGNTINLVDNIITRTKINNAYKEIYMKVGAKQKVWADRDVIIRLLKNKPKPQTALPGIAGEFGVSFYNAEWLARLKAIAEGPDVIERVNSVRSTLSKDMRLSISRAQQKYVTVSKIKKEFARDFRHTGGRRAETIVRTEVTCINNIAQEQAARETGLDLVKVWIRTLDTRTRDTHIHAPTKPIKADEKFIIGGKKMDKPGDPAGGLSEIINCRCVVSYLPADDYEDLLNDNGDFQTVPGISQANV